MQPSTAWTLTTTTNNWVVRTRIVASNFNIVCSMDTPWKTRAKLWLANPDCWLFAIGNSSTRIKSPVTVANLVRASDGAGFRESETRGSSGRNGSKLANFNDRIGCLFAALPLTCGDLVHQGWSHPRHSHPIWVIFPREALQIAQMIWVHSMQRTPWGLQ